MALLIFLKGLIMMKRLALVSCAAIVTAVILTQCKNSKQNNTHHLTTQEGIRMNRAKTASGLEYEILKEGSGQSPQKGNIVTVHYSGWLNDKGNPGRMFDSSHNRNQPFQFYIGVGQVISGWDEGVMGMKVGEKRRLYIPSNLGYGSRGAGSVIPANADLIFDVELIGIN